MKKKLLDFIKNITIKFITFVILIFILIAIVVVLKSLYSMYINSPKGSALYDIKQIISKKLLISLLAVFLVNIIFIVFTYYKDGSRKSILYHYTMIIIPALFWYMLVTSLSIEQLTTLITFSGSFILFQWFSKYIVKTGFYDNIFKALDRFTLFIKR